MVLHRLYTDDGISVSRRLSGKQYMMSFSYGVKMNKFKLYVVKMNKYDIFWWFLFCLSDFLDTFAKIISLIRPSHLFWNLLCCKF